MSSSVQIVIVAQNSEQRDSVAVVEALACSLQSTGIQHAIFAACFKRQKSAYRSLLQLGGSIRAIGVTFKGCSACSSRSLAPCELVGTTLSSIKVVGAKLKRGK